MNNPSIGFIGGGRVARIFLQGWRAAGALPASIVVSDPVATPVATTTDNAAAAAQDIVFLAVHPPVVKDTLAAIAGYLRPEAILVSLAPKWTFARLTEWTGGFARLARVIPNAPSIANAGLNPVSFSAGLSAPGRRAVLALLAPLGQCPEVMEPALEPYAVIAAMTPTIFWPQLYELQALGESFGLTPAQTHHAIVQMLRGCVQTMQESGLSRDQVLDLIPRKPLAEVEPILLNAYRTALPSVLAQIKP
jgi:pyrroline-5-carboxylate reductase